MSTTTQITNISHLLDGLTDYAGEFIADYDMDAVRADYVSMLNCDLPDGITLYANGDVIADLDSADYAWDIDWDDLMDRRPLDGIFDRHDITNRARAAWHIVASDRHGYGHAPHRFNGIPGTRAEALDDARYQYGKATGLDAADIAVRVL